MTDLEKAKAALVEALKARSLIEDEKREAVRAVERQFAERLVEAASAVYAAQAALKAAENALVTPHEWDGRRVLRRKYECRRFSGERTGRFTEFRGVVFTYKHGDDLGRGGPYSVDPGEGLVRLLKKDGEPGKKVERLTEGHWRSDADERWHLDPAYGPEQSGEE